MYASVLWPESLIAGTDSALAAFEDELSALGSPSDEEVFAVVERVVLALNRVNEQQVSAGQTGIETDEREALCDYIDASLRERKIDIDALAARNGIGRWAITDRWRDW
jgi:hypothetical protein